MRRLLGLGLCLSLLFSHEACKGSSDFKFLHQGNLGGQVKHASYRLSGGEGIDWAGWEDGWARRNRLGRMGGWMGETHDPHSSLLSQVVRILFIFAAAVENWSPTFILSAYFLSFFLPAKIPSESCLSSWAIIIKDVKRNLPDLCSVPLRQSLAFIKTWEATLFYLQLWRNESCSDFLPHVMHVKKRVPHLIVKEW